jgi:2,4-dienoyl-CoA reductase-like NADH-dependent reductase (Old Yellow Enzyme family)
MTSDNKNQLFSPLTLRGLTFKNRIAVSPMCQYSSEDGFANDWHLVHLGSRAVGGAALIIMEASAVLPEGRISPGDMGIWKDEHIDFLSRITQFIHAQGSVAGIQIAHAGRKASTARPWEGENLVLPKDGGWENVMAPSAIRFSDKYPMPHAMSLEDIKAVHKAFNDAAKRALKAGFKVLELHSAHGYLFHEFLSPISNHRADNYGGSFENRCRLLLEVTESVRAIWPAELPLFVRISASDWVEGGWDLPQSIQLCQKLKALGVDLIDCSSGGMTPDAKIPAGPNYQVPFAKAIRKEAGIPTGAVGIITEAEQANTIIETGEADLILMAREFLREPYWPLKAAQALNSDEALPWPKQYERAKRRPHH